MRSRSSGGRPLADDPPRLPKRPSLDSVVRPSGQIAAAMGSATVVGDTVDVVSRVAYAQVLGAISAETGDVVLATRIAECIRISLAGEIRLPIANAILAGMAAGRREVAGG